ncbi:MAG: hypothetical protein CL569_20005 [Alphaproteobacteria bacterium]|nr:hypothetical protein [Alphaproteobacteria bacterium]
MAKYSKYILGTIALITSPFVQANYDRLDEEVITVVATKTERSIEQVGATITVINRETIERQIIRDIADLVRYEPGVSVSGTGSRFGLSGFNIRGIDGNRVVTLVDGVRVADQFNFGPFLDSRRDFVDVDSIEVVEIARGPISSLYGSDALGGVVSFTTRSPTSYVSKVDPFYGDVKAGYSSDDDSLTTSANLAFGNDRISALLSYTGRDGNETKTSGSSGYTAANRQKADPQDIKVDNYSLKVDISVAEGHALLLAYDDFSSEVDTQILSDYGVVLGGYGPPTTINSRDAIDDREREKVTLTYRYDGPGVVDRAIVRLYRQSSQSNQHTDETRFSTGPFTRFRYSEFEQDIEGLYIQLTSQFELGDSLHTLTYGAEHHITDSEGLRDGGTFNTLGIPQFEFSPLPTRDFPITKVKQTAFFIQNEIALLEGDLRITPGVRFDKFDANPKPDAIYLSGNPGTPAPENYDDSEVTFSLSGVYKFHETFSVFARYSEGFRAPPYDDVNVGFTNPIGGYKTIANADLTSETSDGFEFGLRFSNELLMLNLAAYRNNYEDFIESLSIAPQFLPFGGVDPSDGFLTFQSVNRAEVEIEGVEFSGKLELGSTGFSLRFALAYADGKDLEADVALDSVNPTTGVIGLEYDANNWGLQLAFTLVKGKDASDINPNSGRMETAGYGVADLLGYLDITDSLSINVGLFNLGDREYIRWADTASMGDDAPERFTQPGFNAGATIRYQF